MVYRVIILLMHEEPREHKSIFVINITEKIERIRDFQSIIDFDLMMKYANNYDLKYMDLHVQIEKNADDFAIREIMKIRQKGLN